jgi:hypothetical protein
MIEIAVIASRRAAALFLIVGCRKMPRLLADLLAPVQPLLGHLLSTCSLTCFVGQGKYR